jgi:hypothetical protein
VSGTHDLKASYRIPHRKTAFCSKNVVVGHCWFWFFGGEFKCTEKQPKHFALTRDG